MLDTIRFKLEAILTDCGDLDNAKKIIKKITDDIRAYNDENKLKTDMHGTFRIIEEYDTLFRTEVNKFMGMRQELHFDRIYQIQEILSICSLLLSYLNTQLKKYNTEASETRGFTAKALRQLVEAKEHYKGEKMSWGGILKSETMIVNALTERLVHGPDIAEQKIGIDRDHLYEALDEVDN